MTNQGWHIFLYLWTKTMWLKMLHDQFLYNIFCICIQSNCLHCHVSYNKCSLAIWQWNTCKCWTLCLQAVFIGGILMFTFLIWQNRNIYIQILENPIRHILDFPGCDGICVEQWASVYSHLYTSFKKYTHRVLSPQ